MAHQRLTLGTVLAVLPALLEGLQGGFETAAVLVFHAQVVVGDGERLHQGLLGALVCLHQEQVFIVSDSRECKRLGFGVLAQQREDSAYVGLSAGYV